MRRGISLLYLGLLAAGCGVSGNGYVEADQRWVSGFSRVVVSGPFDVEVHDGHEHQLTLLTDSNLFRHVETRVEGETLSISFGPAVTSIAASALRVIVELPQLRGAELNGSGRLVSVVSGEPHDVELSLTGSGLLTLRGDARAVTTQSSGSGLVFLRGTASSWNATVSSSGTVDGREMPVEDASLTMAGSGSILAVVNRSVALDMQGSGSIDWWGSAAVTSNHNGGSGPVVHH